jgi:histidine triad (HIT) family protein
VSKEIPSEIIYEDDLCLAFKDINPQGISSFSKSPNKYSKNTSKQFKTIKNTSLSVTFAGPVHFLVIPKDKAGLNRLSSAGEQHKVLIIL